MGMFDNLEYKGRQYQTKDTPSQTLDNYKIEQDPGTGDWLLWHEEYDVDWITDAEHFGGGYMKQYNQRWVCCEDFDGNLRFYRNEEDRPDRWIEYRALFMDGRMLKIREVVDEPLTKWYRQGIEDKGLT
jgi:hypothetical protein